MDHFDKYPKTVTTDSPAKRPGITTILVADPSVSECRNIQRALSQRGYHVLIAHDQPGIVKLCSSKKPEMIIIGSDFDGIHAKTIIRELKTDPRITDIPVVMISSEKDAGEIKSFFSHGVNHLVSAPVDESVLVELVERIDRGARPVRNERILAVTGDKDLGGNIMTTLSAYGYEVELVLNEADGLKLAAGGLFDLALIDSRMPEMDGTTFLGILKSAEKTKNIPVFILARDPDDKASLGNPNGLQTPEGVVPISSIESDLSNYVEAFFESALRRASGMSKVIAIDDSPIMCKLYSQILSKRNYKHQIISDPTTAIETVDKFRPDLILMDQNMPEINGFDLTRMIKSRPEHANVRIIMVTSDAKKESIIKALDSGVVDFLTKPFDEEILLARMKVHLNSKKLYDDLTNAYQLMETLKNKLEILSITDGLTGLFNHRHFYDTLSKCLAKSIDNGSTVSVMLFDVDFFKKFNDTHGHKAGDKALVMVADKIVSAKRADDIAARYGGEEFALILPDTGHYQARIEAEKIRETIENAVIEISGQAYKITVSVGVAVWNRKWDEDQLIIMADTALYQSKENGRNRVTMA